MPHHHLDPPAASHVTRTNATVHRQPVVRPDRSVHGYAVSVILRTSVRAPRRHEQIEALISAEYEKLDLPSLAGPSAVFIRATTAMLRRRVTVPEANGPLVLEIPRSFLAETDAAAVLESWKAEATALALGDYRPGQEQDDFLPLVDYVKVDLVHGWVSSAAAIERAHAGDTAVIAERVLTEESVAFCAKHQVELLQGPLFQRDAAATRDQELTAGEVQCFELIRLLGEEDVNHDKVVELIRSEPGLTVKVLHLVNASTFALVARIDSVRTAVVLLGPPSLSAVAASSLFDSSSRVQPELWFMLAGQDTAYTVGLLSAIAGHLRVEPERLIARTGVSDDVARAMLAQAGPYGPVLAAVLAHEESDISGVEASGLAQADVSHAYLGAVADALDTVASMSI